MTDEQLLESARRGDEAAFQALYERHRDPLFRFAYRFTGSNETAEDVVHDCFLGLFHARFDPERGPLRTYLYAIVRNLARKHFRATGREELSDDFEAPAESSGPLGELLVREACEEVRDAVAALPLLQREVLVLFEYEELPLTEIARVVDTEVGTVKSRLHRARERLRSALRPTLAGSGRVVGV